MSWPWSELGLPGPAGLPEIRRAYAQRLKTTHPEEDPEGFQRLHAAYQEASRYARRQNQQRRPEPQPDKRPSAEDSRYIMREDDLQKTSEEKETEEADWDYDELLENQQGPKKTPEKSEEPRGSSWDYERLFAEGEEEARQARRRKMEALRQKNRARFEAQEREQRKRAADEEEAWTAVMAAAHALELLYTNNAPLRQWAMFLNDPVFWNVRANLDFIFALEDFIEQHPDLSRDIRKAIFSAYGFEKGPGQPVYRRLYQLLGVGRREKRKMAKANSQWRATWRSYPPWRKAIIVVCFSILAVFMFVGTAVNLHGAYRDFTERKSAAQWENQILEWLEEDFGEPFVRPLGGDAYKNIYAPEAEPKLYFWVKQDGEREGRWPGYRTDYPHIRVMRAMEDFADEWNLDLKLDGANGYSGELGSAPGAYLFGLPLLGAGEAITALGELMKDLETQNWYRVLEDRYDGQIVYQVFLCHKGLCFYDAINNKDGGFDADYARARYETQVGPAFCRYLLEESGLAARHMGEEAYVLLDQGAVEISGGTFFWVSGLDKEDYEAKTQYLLAAGGNMLFCLPGDGLTRQTTVTDLYRGHSDTIEVEDVGYILVQDQVGTS